MRMRSTQERTVWIYWENSPGESAPPPYISLCRKIIVKNCPTCSVTLVTPENVRDYLPNVPDNLDGISLALPSQGSSVALKCDFIRAFLLERYGGIYLDSDAVVLKDLGPIFDLFNDWDFIAMRRTSAKTKHISVGFYGSRPQGRVISRYAEKIRRMLSERSSFEWNEVGAWAITPIVDELAESCFLFPEAKIQPITPQTKEAFLSREEPLEPYLAGDPVTFMLFHKIFEGVLRDWSEDELLGGDILLSKLFRYASRLAEDQKPRS